MAVCPLARQNEHAPLFCYSEIWLQFLTALSKDISWHTLTIRAVNSLVFINSNLTACYFGQVVLPLLCRKSSALAMSCTTTLASCSLKCCLL